ncbi:MMPL family transporter [Microbacterium sp. gxy059]|uniref:MMPL family transporter n=1 Tax=Microbacterium sp. gxy059 TaxID=2957199 RepID=UPI003D96664C
MRRMLAAAGPALVRFRRAIVVAWALLAVAGAVVGGGVFDRTAPVPDAPPGSEALLADERLEALAPTGETVVGVITGVDFFDPGVREAATATMHDLRGQPGVVDVFDAYTAGGVVSDDGRSSLVVVELDPALDDHEALAVAETVSDALAGIPAPEVLVGGELLGEQAFADRAVRDAALGEGIAIGLLLVLLTIVLGGFRAGALPVAVALVVVAVSLLVLRALAEAVPVNDFAVNIVTILGLGLAVDCTLLVIYRFLDERARTPHEETASVMSRTLAGAGRAIAFSGLVMCVSLVGMMLLGDPLLTGMAAGGLAAVGVAALAGVTLAPALVAMLGDGIPARGAPTWARPWSGRGRGRRSLIRSSVGLAQRRPAAVALASAAVLAILALPLSGLALGGSDVRALPADSPERRAQEIVASDFSGVSFDGITVLAEGGESDERVRDHMRRIAALEGVVDTSVHPEDLPPDVTAFVFEAEGDATGARAQDLVREIRSLDVDLEVLVGGPAAETVDTIDHLASRLPLAVGTIAVATFGLLFALTRSLVVPLKALLLNGAVIAATLGSLTAIFGWGWGERLLGFESWGGLDVTTPLMIGMLSFGLAMDYEVFLVSRIHEEWRARRPGEGPALANRRAVSEGLVRSAPAVVTAAVAIGIVFAGFSLSGLLSMKEAGIGLLLAVVLDVTVVRLLLLPATMTLLGRVNWWPGARRAPAPSDRERPTTEAEPVPV